MARQILVALLVLVSIVTPARAQTGRVLLDMTVRATPGSESGHCLYVDAGRFFVEGRLVGENPWPARFSLGPALNVPASLDLRITSPNTTSSSVEVEAGIYCYVVAADATEPVPDNAPDQARRPDDLVALRLIWLPATP